MLCMTSCTVGGVQPASWQRPQQGAHLVGVQRELQAGHHVPSQRSQQAARGGQRSQRCRAGQGLRRIGS